MTANAAPEEPFNCPKCGAHDYGLFAAAMVGCPHCMQTELTELRALLAEREKEIESLRKGAESKFADELLCELWKLGVNTDNRDGDEGVIPTLAKCIARAIAAARSEVWERACKAICNYCEKGYDLSEHKNSFTHRVPSAGTLMSGGRHAWLSCKASVIRSSRKG